MPFPIILFFDTILQIVVMFCVFALIISIFCIVIGSLLCATIVFAPFGLVLIMSGTFGIVISACVLSIIKNDQNIVDMSFTPHSSNVESHTTSFSSAGSAHLYNNKYTNVHCAGSLTFNNIEVTGQTAISGSLTGSNGNFASLHVSGSAKLNSVKINKNSHISGSLKIYQSDVIGNIYASGSIYLSNSNVHGKLTSSGKIETTNCKLTDIEYTHKQLGNSIFNCHNNIILENTVAENITVNCNNVCQTIILRGTNTKITGNVVFENGSGEIIYENGAPLCSGMYKLYTRLP